MSENIPIRRIIVAALLGHPLDEDGYAPCPGRHLHSGSGGRRDFRVILEGPPTGFCFHASCADVIDSFNRDLRSKIGTAETSGARPADYGAIMGHVSRAPEAPRKLKRPPFDLAKLSEYAGACPYPIDEAWLAGRSPVPIPQKQGIETAELLLSSLYQPSERVLIFTKEFSQGCFLWDAARGSFRLSETPGVAAVASQLPQGGPAGVWFLAAPVSGQWDINPNNRSAGPRKGRRHGACVTSWRWLVLESDEAPAELWLRAVVQLPLPVCAIYTSGGRSIHALCRVDASCKEEWDALRDDLVPILCPLGADPAAMTAVRLTRLPGTLRHGFRGKDGRVQAYPTPRLQRLLYLNPAAGTIPILGLRP